VEREAVRSAKQMGSIGNKQSGVVETTELPTGFPGRLGGVKLRTKRAIPDPEGRNLQGADGPGGGLGNWGGPGGEVARLLGAAIHIELDFHLT